MKLSSYIFISSLFVLGACKEPSTDITTQDVSNTQSASGSSKGSLPDIKFEEEIGQYIIEMTEDKGKK